MAAEAGEAGAAGEAQVEEAVVVGEEAVVVGEEAAGAAGQPRQPLHALVQTS